jgi:hypothetical protein
MEANEITRYVKSAIYGNPMLSYAKLSYAKNPKTDRVEPVLKVSSSYFIQNGYIEKLCFNVGDVYRITDGKNNYYKAFFNNSELNQVVLAEFKAHKLSNDLQGIKKSNEGFIRYMSAGIKFSLSEYQNMQDKGQEILLMAMTDKNMRKEIMRLGADEFRKTYPDECEGTKAYLSENEDLQKELALSKKIYDMQAKYGNTELNLDETASIPLYVSDVYMAMTNYKTNNTCNNPKFGVNNTVFKDYSRIALLFNRALSQNPDIPSKLCFGLSYDKNRRDKLKLVLLEYHHTLKEGNDTCFCTRDFYQEFKYSNHPYDIDDYKKILEMLDKAAAKAGFIPAGTGDVQMPVLIRGPVGYMPYNPVHFGKVGIRTENEDGFSLILTNPDKAYKNLSEVLPKVFPLYMPYDNSKQFTTKQVVSRKISRFKDNVGLVLYNVKNRSREM